MTEDLVSRRRFLETACDWSMRVLLGSVAAGAARAGALEPGGFARTPLPGACLRAETPLEKTLTAVLETVVPGAETDPDQTPGAVEACAMNLLSDGAFPFRENAQLMAGLVDGLATAAHGVPFAQLEPALRETVLLEAQESLPLLRLAYKAIRSAFYGGAYNGVGLDYVGYPGPNLGYRHLPEFSFRKALSKELTDEGWMP